MQFTFAIVALSLAFSASALPALPRLSPSAVKRYDMARRQNAAAAAAGINDIDILELYVCASSRNMQS